VSRGDSESEWLKRPASSAVTVGRLNTSSVIG
jgi:hypothetical protein